MDRRGTLAVVAGVVGLAALPGGAAMAASKSSHAVNVKASGGKVTNGGTVQSGVKAVGKPFGTCTLKVVYSPPNVTQTWKCPGGNFRGKYKATVNGDTVTGNAKLSKGTGKYKGISGTLKVKASLSKGTAVVKGTARY
jgi:hypothetical protein